MYVYDFINSTDFIPVENVGGLRNMGQIKP
jgi:hypothetical protein